MPTSAGEVWTSVVSSLAPRSRVERLLPCLAGFLWLVRRVQGYPVRYLFVPDLDILVVQIGTWLVLLSGAVAVAAVLWIAVALLSSAEISREGPTRWRVVAVVVVLALGALLRVLWIDVAPAGFWADAVHAFKAATDEDRFFGPHEGRRLVPADVGASRVAVFGLYLDFLRLLLLASGDRVVAYHLMNLIPATILPLAVYALARRFSGGPAPFFSALFVSFSLWPLVLARWGWDQQAMSVLLLFALERLVAGMTSGRTGPLIAGGLLAGAACHTFIGGMLGAGALLAWCGVEAWRARTRKLLLAPATGALVFLFPLLFFYVAHPEMLGGRAVENSLRGSAIERFRGLGMNVLDYAGELFFTPDPNSRHGLREPQLVPVVVVLLVVGLVPLLRLGGQAAARRGLGALFLGTMAGGVLSAANAAPSTYRTGLAGLLAAIPIGLGLACAANVPKASRGFQIAISFLVPALLFTVEVGRYVDWLFPVSTPPSFSANANAVGRLLARTDPERVLVDPAVFRDDTSTPYVAAFSIAPERVHAALRPLRIGTLDTQPSLAGVDWYVTVEARTAAGRSLRLGLPGERDENVVARRAR